MFTLTPYYDRIYAQDCCVPCREYHGKSVMHNDRAETMLQMYKSCTASARGCKCLVMTGQTFKWATRK